MFLSKLHFKGTLVERSTYPDYNEPCMSRKNKSLNKNVELAVRANLIFNLTKEDRTGNVSKKDPIFEA
jgi:hypothetical protein